MRFRTHKNRAALGNALAGTVTFTAEGGLVERFLTVCMNNELLLSNITPTFTGFRAQLPARQYKRLRPIARKCGCRLRITARAGLPFRLYPLRHRAGIWVGMVCAALFFRYCTGLVWSVQYYNVPPALQTVLSEQLSDAGVTEGLRPTDSILRKCEEKILLSCPEVAWVSLNFGKGRLVVEASEAVAKPEVTANTPGNVVSCADGEIVEMEVYEGTALRRVGQYVTRGEILVEGMYHPTRTGYEFALPTHADALVRARVTKTYETAQPLSGTQSVPLGRPLCYRELLVFGFRFSLGEAPGKGFAVVQDKTEPVKLFGFAAPICCRRVTYLPLQQRSFQYTEEQAAQICRLVLNRRIFEDFKGETLLWRAESRSREEGMLYMTIEVQGIADIAGWQPARGE